MQMIRHLSDQEQRWNQYELMNDFTVIEWGATIKINWERLHD